MQQWDNKFNDLLNSVPSINSAGDASSYMTLYNSVTTRPTFRNDDSNDEEYQKRLAMFNAWKSLVMPTSISNNGIEMLKVLEDFRSEAYYASSGETNYIIGYGHVIQGGGSSIDFQGSTYYSITESMATSILMDDLANNFEPLLNEFLCENDILIDQQQYDALIIDCYQKGQYIWGNSYSISEYIIGGDYSSYEQCLAAFLGSTSNEGLINRRTKEADLFYYGLYR